MKRYVLVELDADDWGVTEAAPYVASRDMRGFMGEIVAVELDPAAVAELLAGSMEGS